MRCATAIPLAHFVPTGPAPLPTPPPPPPQADVEGGESSGSRVSSAQKAAAPAGLRALAAPLMSPAPGAPGFDLNPFLNATRPLTCACMLVARLKCAH